MKLQFSLILWRNKEVAKVKLPSKYFYHEVKHSVEKETKYLSENQYLFYFVHVHDIVDINASNEVKSLAIAPTFEPTYRKLKLWAELLGRNSPVSFTYGERF